MKFRNFLLLGVLCLGQKGYAKLSTNQKINFEDYYKTVESNKDTIGSSVINYRNN